MSDEIERAEVIEPRPLQGREKLYVAQAMFKAMGDYVSTKGDGLRAECDQELMAMYESDGIKSLDAKVNGVKVGTYSVTAKKATQTHGLSERDHEAALSWARENGFVKEQIDWDAVNANFAQTGEVPDGCEPFTRETPEHASGTVLRIDPQKVAQALGGHLPQAVAGLLDGETERSEQWQAER